MPFQSQPFEQQPTRHTGSRIALVIGNKNYKVGALRNPCNDALKVSALLKRLGFAVSCRLDLTLEQMVASLLEFTQACQSHETALIYYAGHGMQVDNVNLLVPIDFDLPDRETGAGFSSAALKSTVNLAEILEATRSAMRTLIFLDACREFPEATNRRIGVPVPEAWRSLTGRGFSMLEAEKERDNLVVSFAADAGRIALDGDRRNSPYTIAFAELAIAPLTIGKLLDDLRHKVYNATEGRQRPRDINTLVVPFSLTEGIEVEFDFVEAGTSDDHLFADAAVLDTAEGYRFYLTENPDGRHANEAKMALARLTGNTRVQIDIGIKHCADAPWFTPGRGLNEWFQDVLDAPEMVVVPGLPPSLRGANERARPPSAWRPFAVSRTPITFDQWKVAATAGGVVGEPSDQGWGRGKRPVINVSWRDAEAYCTWLCQLTGERYRLLTIAEWEHCCRGGDSASGIATTEALSAASDPAARQPRGTRVVGLDQPNAYGLYDMLGNVWQWCADAGSSSADRKASGGERRVASDSFYSARGDAFIGFRVCRDISVPNFPS